MIQENIQEVRKNIKEACLRAGRDSSEVILICVSKTKPVEDIRQAYDAGERVFGENKVQELTDKYVQLPEDIQWHLIGHLQRNKVKYIVDKSTLIHSVDSIRLAKQIEDEAVKRDVIVHILVQVNVSNEDTKFGLDKDATTEIIREISINCPHIVIDGLMTIAPFTDEPEENRGYFRELKQLSLEIDKMNFPHVSMKELSMGMTGDYEVAIEEGATMVRVGTGIFGNRNYNI